MVASRGRLAEDWTQVPEEEKRKFYEENVDLAGESLVVKMQEVIAHSTIKRSAVRFIGTGEWLDEVDLDEKYKHKPEQLTNIKENTRTMVCPIRRVKLFEDMKFASETVDEEIREEARERMLETAPKAQPKSKANHKGAAATAGAEGEAEVKLKANEKNKLNKEDEALKQVKLSLMDLVATTTTLKDLVPQYIITHANNTITNLTKMQDVIASVLSKGTAPDFDKLMATADSTLEVGNTAHTRLKVQVDEAKSSAS